MKKILSIILSITMLLSIATIATADGIDGPMQKAKLKVGTSADFKPFEYYDDNGELTGFDIDLMNYIGEKIGFEIEFVNMSFDKLIPAVVSGEVTCAISAITVTEERESVIDYTRPYIKSQYINDLGEKQVEEYAVVFPDNSKNKARVIEASGDPNLSKYMLVDNAIKELTEDLTIDKLIEEYRLNETIDYTYSAIENSNKDEVSDKEIPKYDTWEEIGLVSPYPSEWANESVIKAQALEILEEDKNYWYKNPITREEFCELIYNVIYNYSKVDIPQVATIPLADTSNEKIRSLYWWRIINGKGTFTQEPVISPDGVVKSYPTLPVIAPKDFLTREEAATIIVRMVNRFFPMAATEMWFEYDDINEVSKWASDSVQTISNLGFMKGTNNNKFAPKETLTIEEAIVILVRVYASSGVSKNVIGGADESTGILVGEQNKEDNDKLIYGYQVDDTGKILNLSELKKFYIEFAMDNRIDFIPDFDEKDYKTNNPVSTEEFLMLTYYMNKDNLSEDLSMSAELVEKVMRENFGIEKVEHKSQFKGWTYVEEENKYTPYPEGTAEDGIFDVINFNSYKENDKKIYDVTLREYYLPFLFSKDDSSLSDIYNSYVEYTKNEENVYRENVLFLLDEKGEKIKNAEISIYNAMYELIVEDNTDGFTAGKTIRIKYYIDEITGTPRFIYKNEELSVLQ